MSHYDQMNRRYDDKCVLIVVPMILFDRHPA